MASYCVDLLVIQYLDIVKLSSVICVLSSFFNSYSCENALLVLLSACEANVKQAERNI